MLSVYSYQCECSWNTEFITGGYRRVVSVIERVEKQLLDSKNKQAKAVWRNIYQGLLNEHIMPEEVKVREGFISCSHCKSSRNQIALYNSSTNSLIHPVLCHHCGNEAHFCSPPEAATCPNCQRSIEVGDALSTDKLIKLMLKQCVLTSPTQHSDQVILVIGERSTKYLTPSLIDYPYISIQEGDQTNQGVDLFEVLSNTNKIFLHTYFETPFLAKLILLLMKQLQLMNIDVVPIIVTPGAFEGKQRTEKVMDYINELQSYSSQTVLISGSLRVNGDPVMALYEEQIPGQIKVSIEKYS